jgi:hypothetical protein
MTLIKILQWEIKQLKRRVSKLEGNTSIEDPIIPLSDNTDIITTNELVVMSVDNEFKNITIVGEVTTLDLLNSIDSTDGSIQDYRIYNNEIEIGDPEYVLTNTDILVVTAADGEAYTNYSIILYSAE